MNWTLFQWVIIGFFFSFQIGVISETSLRQEKERRNPPRTRTTNDANDARSNRCCRVSFVKKNYLPFNVFQFFFYYFICRSLSPTHPSMIPAGIPPIRGVAGAGARVPLRGPMGRGDYGKCFFHFIYTVTIIYTIKIILLIKTKKNNSCAM